MKKKRKLWNKRNGSGFLAWISLPRSVYLWVSRVCEKRSSASLMHTINETHEEIRKKRFTPFKSGSGEISAIHFHFHLLLRPQNVLWIEVERGRWRKEYEKKSINHQQWDDSVPLTEGTTPIVLSRNSEFTEGYTRTWIRGFRYEVRTHKVQVSTSVNLHANKIWWLHMERDMLSVAHFTPMWEIKSFNVELNFYLLITQVSYSNGSAKEFNLNQSFTFYWKSQQYSTNLKSSHQKKQHRMTATMLSVFNEYWNIKIKLYARAVKRKLLEYPPLLSIWALLYSTCVVHTIAEVPNYLPLFSLRWRWNYVFFSSSTVDSLPSH